jgi:two-component system catabolic regulation response regulator CreB
MGRILLVEDESAIARTIEFALREDGFDVEHALTGGDALRLAAGSVHDLAILDVGLPDIGGFALCRELRRGRDLPVIFLTARDAEADRVLGFEIGADDYVAKPFSPRELVARVRAV